MSEEKKHVRALIAAAAATPESGDAMRFSQAANNAANALMALQALDLRQADTPDAGDVPTADDEIRRMVNRFLGWRLPENFRPDAGISFKAEFNEHTAHPMKHQPIGTNLFDATQAEAMVRHMLKAA